MSRTDPAEQPSQLNPIQAWLLGHIDTPTLRDHLADSAELAAVYGRVIADPAYAAALADEAQRLLEPSSADVEMDTDQAYTTYEAATDRSDEALLLGQEAEGQQVADEWHKRARDFRDACRSLGLPASGNQVTEREAETER